MADDYGKNCYPISGDQPFAGETRKVTNPDPNSIQSERGIQMSEPAATHYALRNRGSSNPGGEAGN